VRLGYSPFQQVIPSTQKEIDIVLYLADENMLMEVEVIEGTPIKNRGDTLSYFVHPFSDGTEEKVEELLAKLPGLSVDQRSGTIKYQGKEIKKILLDGDDLMGGTTKC
jgi:hypothetical protein|tara:strand:+ start:16300 stop:16623 length:324 start_codon:yes stop_codon:yes gene_type:complete